MPDAPVIVRCPRCGHPYPMTPTQLSVFLGRTMGCMACGRPFEVHEPPSPPPPVVSPVAAAPTAAAGEIAGNVGSTAVPAIETTAVTPSAGVASAPATFPGVVSAAWPASATPEVPEQRPSWSAVLAVGAGVMCPVLLAAAAVVGASTASPDMVRAVDKTAPVVLIRLSAIAAAVGVIAGAIALWQNRRREMIQTAAPPPQGRAYGIAALSIGLTELVVLLLVTVLSWPSLASAMSESHKAACQNELETLGRLLVNKAMDDPAGRFPSALGDVVRSGDFPANALACPGSYDKPVAANLPSSAQADLINSGQHLSYVYLGSGMTVRADGNGVRATTQTILAYEKPGHHRSSNGIHVLFADGSVMYVDAEVATALLNELRAGQNPPPMAGMLRR